MPARCAGVMRRASQALTVVCTAVLAGCAMPDFDAVPAKIAALPRESVVAAEVAMPLSYIRAGDDSRPRVIYIHGTPGSAGAWADYLSEPVPGLEAVAVDRLGFGKSGGRRGGVDSFEKQAEAIAPLLVERGGRWPILVGHSLGGPIAARLAAMHPDRVGGLVIVAGSLDPELERPSFWQWLGSTWLVRAMLPQTLDNTMGELDAAKAQTTLLAPELGRITCPVIAIHGTADELVPYANTGYIRRMLVNARSLRLVTLEGQGHFIPWERADTIRDAVSELAR